MANNFVVSYSYDLPFQKLGQSTSGSVHKLLDGWQFSGITRFTTGFPVKMGETGDQSLCGGCTELPDYNAQPIQYFNPRASSSHEYFSAESVLLRCPGRNRNCQSTILSRTGPKQLGHGASQDDASDRGNLD